ncbi:hypothetical protein CTAYLR_006082 [Chrysophaeum taylorii]|uniref:PA domain-containing protein n=1 Tax=Chrysophaeum taylorii TaxID=2483200 RepID=A0AAD7XPN2_9STRA|nr:hypothetical protein CTAYLR_006082 [Chrysophaeum taylorii]
MVMRFLLFPCWAMAGAEDWSLKAILVHGKRSDKRTTSDSALARLEFCARCVDPHEEGSFAHGLTALQGTQDYKVTASLAYAVPNDASRAPMNSDEIKGKLVVVDRGVVPLVQKVLAMQAGDALGVVIVDDGQCTIDLDCGRAGSPRMGGFAPKDDPQAWRQVTIPAILISAESGARLRRLMPLDRRDLPRIGFQFLNRRPHRRAAAEL